MLVWPAWRGWCLWALGLAQVSCLVIASEQSNVLQLTGVLLAAGFAAIAFAWIAYDRQFEHLSLPFVVFIALTLRLLALQASPLLEDDHYRYLWDGMRMSTSFDPYRQPPAFYFADAQLSAVWQAILNGINNPHLPTIYGPTLQWLFALAYAIAPGKIGALQGLLGAIDLVCVMVLIKARVGVRWLLIYALHPLILKEAIASAHPDGLLGLLLLLAFIALHRRYTFCAGILLGAAVATKVSALVVLALLPWFGAPVRRLALGFIVSIALLYGPFLMNKESDFLALTVFAQSWQFNPLLFRFFEAWSNPSYARIASGVSIVGIVFFLAWKALRFNQAPWHYWDVALLVLLSFAPVINPWYWLWALPLAMLNQRVSVPVVGLVTTLAYANDAVLMHTPNFYVPWPITLIQVAVLVVCCAKDAASRHATYNQTYFGAIFDPIFGPIDK